MPLEFLFGKKKTPQEILRQNQRALNKAMRDLDRERQRLEQQENKIKIDIKKMANQGQMVNHIINLLLIMFLIHSIFLPVTGCSKNHGPGPSEDKELCEEIHCNES